METTETSRPEAQSIVSDEELAEAFKALAHPVRLKIVRHLKAVDRCICGEIVEIFPLAQSTVSKHLKYLKDAGLVRGTVEGPSVCYCLDKERLAALRQAMKSL